MSRARDWTRRAVLSALAGGGLTGASLAGPALGAEAPAGAQEPPPPTTGSPAPAPSEATATTPTTSTPAPGSTSTTPSSPPPEPAPSAPKAHGRKPAPTAVGQQQQPSTAQPSPAPTSPTPPPPVPAPATATLPQSAPANIAPAPQLAAGQMAPGFDGSLVSMQALGFYRIPLFLLPIYQAAANQYGVPWQILAAINEVETNYGTDLAVSTAGAVGWMQFMPETWLQYGVDAVNAGYADPYNPVDAIFAAARYLHAAGAPGDLVGAILAYNHSQAYVESVMLRARLIASYPASVIATLTGLTDGTLPAPGAKILATSASSSSLPGSVPAPAPARSAEGAADAPASPSQLTKVLTAKDSPVVAVKDGRIVRLGHTHKLGDYLVLRDTYGDLFTYAGLGEIAPAYRLSQAPQLSIPKGALRHGETGTDSKPSTAATSGRQLPVTLHVAAKHPAAHPAGARRLQAPAPSSAGPAAGASGVAASTEGPYGASGKVRVFAHPGNPDAVAAVAAQAARAKTPPTGWAKLDEGALVAQGTVLGRARSQKDAGSRYGSLRFAIRPAGSQAAIDPSPIFENWRQLDAALHPQGAKPTTPLAGATAGQAFQLGVAELERAVLSDPEIELSACDRQQVASGRVDRRLLALLVFLSRSDLKPTVSEIRCPAARASLAATAGHAPHDSLKITAINGIPVAAHQGAGTITDVTIRTLLTVKRQFAPQQIVSLMQYPGAPTTLARADHGSYIEIRLPSVRRSSSTARTARAHGATPPRLAPRLGSAQWNTLVAHVKALPNPRVPRKPSAAAIRDSRTP